MRAFDILLYLFCLFFQKEKVLKTKNYSVFTVVFEIVCGNFCFRQ